MSGKSWAIFIAIVAAIIGGMVYTSSQNKLNVDDIDNDAANKLISADERTGGIAEHTIGNKDADIVVVEYADFQCPGCSTAAPIAKDAIEKYEDDVLLIFRHFPISSIHPNARSASAATLAADAQGKFWEMHDLIFENQDAWSNAQLQERNEFFNNYAKQLDLDIDKFNEDMSSKEVEKKINFDVAIARAKDVTGTPAFFLNGEPINHSEIESKIKEAIENKKSD